MVDSLFKMFKLKFYIVFLVYPKFSKFLDVVFGRLFWLCHWHRENWDCKVRHFQKEISRENTTRREVIQRTKVTTRLLPQRIQFHKKFTMFFLKATTCFKAMPQCHFVSLFFFAFFIPFRSNQLLREAFCACV